MLSGVGAVVERPAARLGAAVGLAAVWQLLCGQVSVGTVLGGVVAGAAVVAVTPMPPIPLRLRVHPLRLATAVGRLGVDLVRATTAMAWAAVRTGPDTRSVLVTVPLRAEQDALMVLVASWLSLTPGTLVVRIDAEGRELHLHVTPVPPGGAEQVRRDALRTEARLLLALGVPTGERR